MTAKLVYVYQAATHQYQRLLVAATRDAEKLKNFAWDIKGV
jgi:hypothetical protein